MTLPPHVEGCIDRTSSPRGCWLWTGARSSTGYGQTTIGGRNRGAHRAVYELLVGTIGPGLVLLHACDDRRCVNPAHLTPGTHQENAQDRARKGRGWRQERRAPGAPEGRRWW